jgi:hypothetical protein
MLKLIFMSICVAADGGNEKHKRKRAKPDGISKRNTKKTKVQAAVPEKRAVMSEATDNITKINSNEVQEHNSPSTPHQIIFDSSLYTQELSNKETDSASNKLVTETSTATNPEHVAAPESTQPSKYNEEQETTNEMEKPSDNDSEIPSDNDKEIPSDKDNEIPSDNDNETQFNIKATLDESVINCSQDLFTSQTATTEQNRSEKNKEDTATGISWIDFGLNKLSTSSEARSRNVNANLENKNSEFTADSCVATVGEKSVSEQIQTADCTDRDVDVVADKNSAEDQTDNDKDNHTILTEVESSASVLQPDTQIPSTSNAAAGSQLNCSDNMPLVPDIQQNDFQVKANQNCDAVVPQLDDDKFGDNFQDSLDFEPEE